MTPEQKEVERAKERFKDSGRELPRHVRWRDKIYETVDAEEYQGLVIVNLLDDNGKIVRADGGLVYAAPQEVCPHCKQEIKK